MTEKTIKVPLLFRAVDLADLEVRREDGKPTRIRFSGSSTYRVERFFGNEVLDHSPGAVRLERAKGGALPLLFNHNPNDIVGMVDSVTVKDERTIVDAHFFDTPRAMEVQQMIEGGLRNVSAQYRVHRIEEHPKTNTSYVREWEPFEYSFVTLPQDPTVGVGRAIDPNEFEVRMVRADSPAENAINEDATMTPENQGAAGNSAGAAAAAGAAGAAAAAAAAGAGGDASRAMEFEQQRKRGIENLCKANNIDEKIRDHWITSGLSLDAVTDDLLRIIQQRGVSKPQSAAFLGLTGRETERYSLARALLAVYDKDWSKAGFELECSRSIAQALGKSPEPTKFYVPLDVQRKRVDVPIEHMLRRDLTVATAGAGGYLVETSNLGFVEMLRNMSVMLSMGATRLTGLQGNLSIPKQSAAGTAYWLANEATQITESQQTFVQIALTPKTVGAYTEISRQLLLQSSPQAEGIVIADLAQVVALAADLAGLNGSGASGQPTGILNTAGIGSVTGTSLAYDDIVEFQTDVAAGNALFGDSGFVTTPAVAGLLKQRVKFTSTASPIWEGQLLNGQVDGHRAMASNQMPSATMLFGAFSRVIVGEWGVLEIETNPYANFQAGIMGVRAMYSLDIGVRYASAFSAASTIT